jgi:uncharacterized protein YdiU (UPF0061 family)
VFSYIDRRGRYAYGNQPVIMQWNLARFAETLLPLIDADGNVAVERATALVHAIPARYSEYWLSGFRRKLGLQTAAADDATLIDELLQVMQTEHADFTNTFRALADAATDAGALPVPYASWRERWISRLAREPGGTQAAIEAMRRANPAYIPRNHRIEAIISAAVSNGDFAPFHQLHAVLSRPFDDQPDHRVLREPPRPEERISNTFCGT